MNTFFDRAACVVLGMSVLAVWWCGHHTCYDTLTGLICTRHAFNWDDAFVWLRVIK